MFWRTHFNLAEASAHADIQGEFSECFQINPMKTRPNYSPATDPTRKSFTLTAIFEWESKMVGLGMETMEVSSREPKLTARRCDIPSPVKRGDRITRIITGEMFEVTETHPDSLSGVKIKMVELGVQ